jgi:flagellum-specific peptidoglycan hydrolase FlgJ
VQTKKKQTQTVSRKQPNKKIAQVVRKSKQRTKTIQITKPELPKETVLDSTKIPTTEVIVSTSKTKVTLETINNYILQYKDIAMGNMRSHGIPASIILAQGILESGAGAGDLARDANNHFGIKCHKDWMGESVRHDDDAAQECFRKYPQAADSFQDHATFLSSRGRYSALFKLPKSDYRSWARGLRAAGYATDPRYPEKLITYIQKYSLHQYDNLVLGIEVTSDTTTQTIENTIVYPIITQNGNTHQVQKGDTYYSISKKYNLSVADLKQMNGLSENTLSIGQVLRIKNKELLQN